MGKNGPWLGVRHVQMLLLFLNRTILLITRFHIQVTLVAMTNAAKANTDFPEYNWTEKHKSFIFASYFAGSLLSQLPIVYFIRHFRVKTTLTVITLVSGVLNCLVPWSVSWGGYQILCALRFIQGLFEAGSNPASQQHFAHWAPPDERNRFGGFLAMGVEFGFIIAMAMSGLIAKSPLGWPGMFYFIGLICCSWCIFWLIFGENDLTVSKFITTKEREYIEGSLKNSVNFEKKQTPIPWKAILTSKPFWATLMMRLAESWFLFVVVAQMPAYLNGVFKVEIREIALISALPNLVSFLLAFVFMALANLLRKRQLLTLDKSRKVFNSISMWLPAAGLIWLGFLKAEQKLLVYIVLTMIIGFLSAETFGNVLSRTEIAPNHAGTVTTIVDFISQIIHLVAPLFMALIVNNESNRYQWQIAFAVTALINCVCDITFLLWGTSVEQPWNSADFLKTKQTKKAVTPKYIKKDFELNPEIQA